MKLRRVVPFAMMFVSMAVAAAGEGAAVTTRTLYVPTSASIHGAAGTFFHTDLWAFNRSFDAPITVTATYRCFSGPCSASVKTFVLAVRESKLIADVVGTLFLLPETAGAIELSYQSASDDLAATTRTYTPSLPSPTNGTSIPAMTMADARSRAVFLGLANSGGYRDRGFRTNAGAFLPARSGFSTTVTYSLYKGDGTFLGSASHSLSGGGTAAGQINDLFGAAGIGSVVENAVLVVTSTYPVLPFVTVIDNQSGDSVFVQPSDDGPVPPLSELVTNGGFDGGISGWTAQSPSFITLAAAGADGKGRPGSGSLLVTNTFLSSGSGSGARQCLTVSAGDHLDLGARAFVPSAQAASGTATVQLYFDGGAGCTGDYLGRCTTLDTGQLDQWVTLTATCTVPAGAKSGELVVFTSKAQGTGGYLVYFDDVSVTKGAR